MATGETWLKESGKPDASHGGASGVESSCFATTPLIDNSGAKLSFGFVLLDQSGSGGKDRGKG
jgi:hypothetical protein